MNALHSGDPETAGYSPVTDAQFPSDLARSAKGPTTTSPLSRRLEPARPPEGSDCSCRFAARRRVATCSTGPPGHLTPATDRSIIAVLRGHGASLALVQCVAGFTLIAAGQIFAQQKPQPNENPAPAEEQRLDTAVFRAALKRRGLTELLELHLKDFPPPGRVARHLSEYDVTLAVFSDHTRPVQERRTAIRRANEILATLIEEGSDDPRRLDWRFTLARSSLYDEARPYFTSILYRGGSELDRRRLLHLTTRALAALNALTEDLSIELARVDALPVREFERLERSGYIDKIDRLGPTAAYLHAWARFYDSLARAADDPTRARRLHAIVDYLAENPSVLETPHSVSHVQVPALVLAGMTKRRLFDYAAARSLFDRALRTADQLADPELADAAAWAVPLARIERIRNDRDDGRFDEAINSLVDFRRSITSQGDKSFGLRFAAALLERSVHRARADAAETHGRRVDAERLREEAWNVLARFTYTRPARRDEIYATVHELMGADADPVTLDPFEQCAHIAGLLFDAGRNDDETPRLLERAVRTGEYFLANAADRAGILTPEVLYNLGVARYRLGNTTRAAARFIEVARDYTSFQNALQAAVNAVQLTARLYTGPTLHADPELQQLYLTALQVLVGRFPNSNAAHYWRFYYAQLLDELGKRDQAADEYEKVDTDHEHYLESRFLRVRCQALALSTSSGNTQVDVADTRRRADEFLQGQRKFVALVSGELARNPSSPKASMLKGWKARATLLAAETLILPQIDQPARALETLNELDAGVQTEQPTLTGRLWRVRLLAYEKLGRLDEATAAIPTFVAADPDGAVPVLQSLYTSLVDQVKNLRREGNANAAQHKAQVALVLAQQIAARAAKHDTAEATTDRAASATQLAEAYLRVGHYDKARELLEPLAARYDPVTLPTDHTTLRALLGYAESLYQLGDWATALGRFNVLATSLPTNDPVRWQSLLRDLQCRTALGHPPEGIIAVIQQQRFLHPKLGGAPLAAEFEKLQRENQRRVDAE
ncbi:MAG: tetratricopeptide repeat protein [Phycisphaerae bacterium]